MQALTLFHRVTLHYLACLPGWKPACSRSWQQPACSNVTEGELPGPWRSAPPVMHIGGLFWLGCSLLFLIFQGQGELPSAQSSFSISLKSDPWCLQATENEEVNSKIIPKLPPFSSLLFGCSYQVSNTSHIVIMPEVSGIVPFFLKKKGRLWGFHLFFLMSEIMRWDLLDLL